MATAHFGGLSPFISPGNSFAIWNMKGSSYAHMKSLPVFVKGASMENSFGFKDVNPLMELRKQIMKFRDIIDLPPCDGSASANELVTGTVEDLQNHYPVITPRIEYAQMKGNSFEQDLSNLCKTLKSIGESWMLNCDGIEKPNFDLSAFKKNINSENLVETASEILDCLIAMARERYDVMDEDDEKNELSSRENSFNEISPPKSFPGSNPSSLSSSPTSVLPHYENKSPKAKENLHNISHNSSHLLLSLRVQAVGKLNPINVKCLSSLDILNTPDPASVQQVYRNDIDESLVGPKKTSTGEGKEKENYGVEDNHVASNVGKPSSEVTVPTPPPPPPPPKMAEAKESAPLPPPPPMPVKNGAVPPPTMPGKNGAAPPPPPPFGAAKSSPLPGKNGAGPPPPPPLGATKSLKAKATKLKRSSHMGNLYRSLKGKVEGSTPNGKSSAGRKGGVGSSSTGGKQGMADALAEMTKRSAYFQQIEEDVQKYAKSITELKSKITSFQSKDMNELLRFHKDVESVLEHLTDESQVLARCEEFPVKKLETLRTASALYSKLNAIIEELQNWKIVAPLGAVLDKVERYFNKIKGELDKLERTKDEESKKFQSQNIHFDFNILIRIKELMVDVSSSCMELALKERREAKAVESGRNGSKGKQGCGKMLWKAFQFAFRVYTFAGGHDDRADKLTRELAHEIETDPNHDST